MTVKTLAVAASSLVLCASAQAGTFQVGIAEPGAGPIPAADVSALGVGVERRSIIWHGEASFTGTLTLTPGVRAFVTVWGGYSNPYVPTDAAQRARYCGFVASILHRYPTIHDVIVWNEANLAGFWGIGVSQYALLVRDCSPIIRAAGARVYAGMSPSTVKGVSNFARHVAALGPHLIDGWSHHDYTMASLNDRISAVRAAFGWKVSVLVGESGTIYPAGVSALMGKAYCAGATGWLNFKLRDNGNSIASGLENADGSHKASYGAFARTAKQIRSGSYRCSGGVPATKPANSARRLHRAYLSHRRASRDQLRRGFRYRALGCFPAGPRQWVCPLPSP